MTGWGQRCWDPSVVNQGRRARCSRGASAAAARIIALGRAALGISLDLVDGWKGFLTTHILKSYPHSPFVGASPLVGSPVFCSQWDGGPAQSERRSKNPPIYKSTERLPQPDAPSSTHPLRSYETSRGCGGEENRHWQRETFKVDIDLSIWLQLAVFRYEGHRPAR